MITKEQFIESWNTALKAMQHNVDSQVMSIQNYANWMNNVVKQLEEKEAQEAMAKEQQEEDPIPDSKRLPKLKDSIWKEIVVDTVAL